MRYLITTNNQRPFLTDWFDAKNNFNKEVEMVVYDLYSMKYTLNGNTWMDIAEDHL